jgi:hypothetical protein
MNALVPADLDERPERDRLDTASRYRGEAASAKARAAHFREIERKAKAHAENCEQIAQAAELAAVNLEPAS